LALIVVLIPPAVHAAEPLFSLEAGLELRYTMKSANWFDGKDGKADIPREADGKPKYDQSDLTVCVLGRQREGSYRVLMQRNSGTGSPLITCADLFPDGRMTLIPSAMPLLEFDSLRTIFPLLPKDESEKTNGWTEVERRTDLRMRFSTQQGIIKAECDGPLDRVSLGRWSIRYKLDPKTHLPVEVLTDGRWDRYKETSSTIVTMNEIVRHDRGWVEKFTANAEKYFEAAGKQKRAQQNDTVALAIAERERPGAAGEMLDARKASLVATREAVTEPMFRDDLDRRIKQCDDFRTSRVESAKQWAKIAGLPAPEWKITDLDGHEQSLAQCRGRVVVLDFWFRQCSFCIRAMPQVEQVEARLRQEKAPVSFFGVSIDKEAADAKFVADTMKLSYPVLRSEELAERLGIKTFPTVLVIAPDGTVQGIFVGYSLTLREDLMACVQELLKK
jgi:thiol-disulfide isomerase/thioredoxin